MDPIERIYDGNQLLVLIVRHSHSPTQTEFLTQPDFKQQVGFIVYPKGGEIWRHFHRPLERHLIGMSELLLVRSGRLELDVYNDSREVVATKELTTGDVVLMVAGGHGFRVLEDTILLEVKQGPYLGNEKERF